MGFFWKFIRSGKFSASYVSLIIDVDPDCVDRKRNVWRTSFEELGMAMILLHDVEVLNQPKLGATKPAFREVVESLGYEPTLEYRPLRERMGLVMGQCVMGGHDGFSLDWGRYESNRTLIEISTAGLQVAAFVQASDGRLYGVEDKLSCYRSHPRFPTDGCFYDLMPKHVVMKPFIEAMRGCDEHRTDAFVSKWLKWVKR